MEELKELQEAQDIGDEAEKKTKKSAAKKAEPADIGEELVDFIIPRSGPDEKPFLIGVNGEFITVMPGVPVQVKRKYVEVYEHSKAQEQAAWKAQLAAMERGKRAIADL